MPTRIARALPGLLRAHWLAVALMAAGLTLRALATAAYHPALLYVDTLKYLYGAWPGADPLGYKYILRAILLFGDLGTVAVVQHLLGLAMAVVLYVLLLRRGAPRWMAALAIAPVLLDAYQLQAEQTIMPDVWFEAFAVAGLAVLLWRPRPSLVAIAGAGLIFGASATVRQIGEVLIAPALIYLVAAGGGWRRVLRAGAVMTAAFALPILAYSSVAYAQTGHFQLSDEGGIAGRIAGAVDCATLKIPAALRPICPTPAQQLNGPDWLEHSSHSSLKHFPVPAGMSRNEMLSQFDTAVETQQPLRIVTAILRDSVRIFALTRTPIQSVTPISRWQFQTSYPKYLPEINVRPGGRIILGIQVKTTHPFSFRPLGTVYGGKAQVDKALATFLHDYQLDGGYTPGPLLALFTLAGLGGSLLTVRRRRRRRRRRGTSEHQAERTAPATGDPVLLTALACLIFFTATVGVLGVSDIFEFSWRYQLPALVLLPPAGALGARALWLRLAGRRGSAAAAAVAEPSPVAAA